MAQVVYCQPLESKWPQTQIYITNTLASYKLNILYGKVPDANCFEYAVKCQMSPHYHSATAPTHLWVPVPKPVTSILDQKMRWGGEMVMGGNV